MQPARPDACRIPLAMAPLIAAVFALIACDPASVAPRPINPQVVWGETGDRPGQFFYPRALDADRDGRIWIIDKTARVQALDPDTGEPLFTWRMPNYELGKPTGMTFAPGPDGRELLYIADTHYHRVMVYRTPTTPNQREELVASFGSYGDQPGQFIYPTDVAVLTDQQTGLPTRIYVSEYGGNDRISVFDPNYNFLFAFGSPGSSADPATIEFNRPQSIAVDTRARQLVVVDSCNHRIGRFTLDGKLLAWFGSHGSEVGGFNYPFGLHLLDDGTALVTEFGNHRLQRVDLASGRSIGTLGREGSGHGELRAPWAVTTIGTRAYVLDSGNNRVIGFKSPG